MTKTSRLWIVLAGLMGAEAVIAGALSAHAGLSEQAVLWVDKAVSYEFWHALALLAVALLSLRENSRLLTLSGVLFTAGVALFCGTLYMKGFWEITPFPMSAPLGGFCLIGGWCVLAFYGFKAKN
ncbi:membrane protein [Terasakiella brassicae]|uniref:Membrane protein n=1 Tax=Terasakiella brassicae TaxID=1634917 RepID=A0A917F9M7_9PROT|nr:DUF423 domain-containing protein [Terasakiella brassicae]GGF55769.1 membrane protein [Terasakiella brassicae]